MSSILRKSLKNSASGLLFQIIMIPLNFCLRVILLKYVGVEIVGISGTATSMVGILSLAEGGFSAAISYCLYKPIVAHDEDGINRYMSVFKTVYFFLAIFVIFAGAILSFFIKYIFKGIEINFVVYAVFFLDCINSAVSYLLCHRRILLIVDLKSYIANYVDIICNILFTTAGVFVVYKTRVYIYYLVLMIAKTIASNIIIHIKCKQLYPFLKNSKMDRDTLKEVAGYSKNLVFGNIAAYVFNSTDNIVISSSSSTVNVGYLSNYTMITTYLRSLSAAVISGIGPAVGQLQVESSLIRKRNIYYKYTQICYLLAFLVCVPTYVLLDSFIINVYGEKYLLGKGISALLTLILYLFLVSTPYGTFLTTNGEFVTSKKADFVAAVYNLGSSIILVQFWGIEGVLLGTVIGMVMAWFVRGYFVLKNILRFDNIMLLKRVLKEMYSLFLIGFGIFVVELLSNYIVLKCFTVKFVVLGFVSIICSMSVYIALYRFKDKITIQEALGYIEKIIGRKS